MDKFSKIIGYEKEKEELKRTADMLKNSEKYLKRGVVIPNALLLYGVPGTGKTVMARAMIAESGLPHFDCKKDTPNGAFVNNIRNTFKEAEENAPAIVFLDDMDKFAELGLETEPGLTVAVPGIRQLPLTLECKVIYRQDQDSSLLHPDVVERYYKPGTRNEGDYHTMYFGEITGAYIIE